jgi:CheY-like chemotaxis protein
MACATIALRPSLTQRRLHMNPSIAIIDDDYDDVFILSQALAEIQPSTTPFTWYDAVEAIKNLTATNFATIPSHIFVDFNMPVLNGKECVKALRGDNRYSSSVITVVSTNFSPEDKREFQNLGANHVFIKPACLPDYLKLLAKVFT